MMEEYAHDVTQMEQHRVTLPTGSPFIKILL